jgi:hypothetical protein
VEFHDVGLDFETLDNLDRVLDVQHIDDGIDIPCCIFVDAKFYIK